MESFVERQIYSSTAICRCWYLKNSQISHQGLLSWRAQSLFNVQNLVSIVKIPGKLEVIWAKNYTIVYRPPNQWFFPRALLIILRENSFILKSLKLGTVQSVGKKGWQSDLAKWTPSLQVTTKGKASRKLLSL